MTSATCTNVISWHPSITRSNIQGRQCVYERNSKAPSCNHIWSEKGIGITYTYSECVSVPIFIQFQYTCTIWYCHPWSVWWYSVIPNYLINGTFFKKKYFEHKICIWFSLQILFEIYFILRTIQRYTTTNVLRSLCKGP